jgi:hypothetical protein
MPDLNEGKDWSKVDIRDLRAGFANGRPLKEVAAHLCRGQFETLEKARELGIHFDANQGWIENLRYSVDIFDAKGNLEEVVGRVESLDAANAVYDLACKKYQTKLVYLRERARVLRRSDRTE